MSPSQFTKGPALRAYKKVTKEMVNIMGPNLKAQQALQTGFLTLSLLSPNGIFLWSIIIWSYDLSMIISIQLYII